MVGTQKTSETQKMLRPASWKCCIAGFEGVPAVLSRTAKLLQQCFGQPHVITAACVDALVDGPNISSNDGTRIRPLKDIV